MTVRYSTERFVDAIITQIQQNIDAALARVRTERHDARINTTKPVKYYISEFADPQETPAIFVILKETDYKKDEKQANYLAGVSPLRVSIIVEDANTEVLMRRVWRYQAALAELLDQVGLTGQGNTYKLVLVVNKAYVSNLYSNSQAKNDTKTVFRLEGILECTVNSFENL